jgi:hypothetical protein
LKLGIKIILDQAENTMMMIECLMEPGSFDKAFNHSDLD